MKIVIIGCGKIGLALIEQLSREEHDLIAVDSDAALVEEIVNDYDVQGVAGNGASDVHRQRGDGQGRLHRQNTAEQGVGTLRGLRRD